MVHKVLKVRADFIVGLVAIAASIFVAIWMHRTVTDRTYSCLRAPCLFQWTFGYPVIDRLGFVAAGLLAAGVIIAVGTFMRRHFGDGDHGQLEPGLGAGIT
jgi:hypothetical protein